MFDISPLELLTIAIVALIVFGPQRLPDIARKVGGYIREVRNAATQLTAGLDAEVRELAEPIKELKQDLTQPLKAVKESLDDTAKQVQEPIQDAQQALKGSLDETKRSVRDPLKAASETPAATAGDEAKSSAAEPTAPDDGAAPSASEDGDLTDLAAVAWIGDEPSTGVSPSEAWDGMDDPVPDGLDDGEVLETMRTQPPDEPETQAG